MVLQKIYCYLEYMESNHSPEIGKSASSLAVKPQIFPIKHARVKHVILATV